MLDLNIDALLAYLKEQKIPAQKQVETNQIIILFHTELNDIPLFLRTVENSQMLQVLAFIPGNIKEGAQSDIARLMHHLNRQLDIPGFGMDESAGVIFYRYMLSCPENRVSESHLLTLVKSIEVMCNAFSPLILAVAAGKMSLKEGLRKLQQMENMVAEEGR